MLASFLLSLREGLEAALIIGIVLGVLLKLKRTELNKTVWLGAGIAALISAIAVIALNLLGMKFEGRAEEIFEGVAMLLVAGALTRMIFWMLSRSTSKLNLRSFFRVTNVLLIIFYKEKQPWIATPQILAQL